MPVSVGADAGVRILYGELARRRAARCATAAIGIIASDLGEKDTAEAEPGL